MAHYFLFPEKDATLYSHPSRAELNTGLDEILQLGQELSSIGDIYYPTRILIKFKDSEINNTIDTKVKNNPFTASLKLFQSEHSEITLDQNIEAYPVFALESYGWNNGTGRVFNSPQTLNGVSWKFKDNATLQDDWVEDPYAEDLPEDTVSIWYDHTTGSYFDIPGGGTWYTGSGFEVSQSYTYNEVLDLELDVTSPIQKFYNRSKLEYSYPDGIPNNGFLLKRPDNEEFTEFNYGILNYFGVDTHTIYPPILDISWDDSNYDTNFATGDKIKTTGECYVTLRNNKEKYHKDEEPKFRLNVRELYPTRKFVTSSNYLDVNYFTSKSFYSLVDYATEETVIPFGPTSKLSADKEGMYFKLYMNGLQEERYYKLLFKHENDDGITVYDENYYFKVVKS